jgi:thioredoxin reductase
MATAIPQQLGCAFEDGPLGQFVRTDALKETTVSGVFACGDAPAERATSHLRSATGAGRRCSAEIPDLQLRSRIR